MKMNQTKCTGEGFKKEAYVIKHSWESFGKNRIKIVEFPSRGTQQELLEIPKEIYTER